MIRATCDALPVPALPDLTGRPRDSQTHDRLAADIPALGLIETGGQAPAAPLALPIGVAAWNLERCLFPEASAAHVADCDLWLLSEMDNGMARTAQRHTTAEMAAMLGGQHAYVVEYLELGLGAPIERDFCTDDRNARGFHGNALIARGALHAPFALRLFGHRQWFADPDQPRLGERVALGARIETEAGPFLAVSTHLESAASPAHRAAQIEGLIAALDHEFPHMPVLIGGDLNTGNHAGGDWRAEPLFDIARAAGFSVHGGPEDQPTTRASLLTRFPDRVMKLDWFLARGMRLGPVEIRPACGPDGTPLSDHDAIVTRIEALEAAPA